MSNTVKWLTYEFVVCNQNGDWNDVGGVYIFCGVDPLQNVWKAKYIGQTGSFKDRIPNHDQWNEAVRLGATHVHAKVVPLQSERDAIEGQLLRAFHPPLNTQLK